MVNASLDSSKNLESNETSLSLSSAILVTGGSGLLGSHLLKQLTNSKKKIKALYRKEIPVKFDNKERIEWVKGDILDVSSLEEVLEGVSHVYHCAAVVSFNNKRKREMYATNVQGTTNVVNAALEKRVKKICYVSSVAALGKKAATEMIDERLVSDLNSFDSDYARSKYMAEMEVWRGIGEGLEGVIVNPAIILGTSNWNSGSTKIFKTCYEEFPWFTDGITGFVDVIDTSKAMIALMESNITGQRFIISNQSVPYREVFSRIAEKFRKRPPHKKASFFMANATMRYDYLRSKITHHEPFLTEETAKTAFAKVYFNNSKLKRFLPNFNYTSLDQTLSRVCKELIERYHLPI